MEDGEEEEGVCGSRAQTRKQDGEGASDSQGRVAAAANAGYFRVSRSRPAVWVQDLSPELRHGYRILSYFLQDKHRGLCQPFLQSKTGDNSKATKAGEYRGREMVVAGFERVPGPECSVTACGQDKTLQKGSGGQQMEGADDRGTDNIGPVLRNDKMAGGQVPGVHAEVAIGVLGLDVAEVPVSFGEDSKGREISDPVLLNDKMTDDQVLVSAVSPNLKAAVYKEADNLHPVLEVKDDNNLKSTMEVSELGRKATIQMPGLQVADVKVTDEELQLKAAVEPASNKETSVSEDSNKSNSEMSNCSGEANIRQTAMPDCEESLEEECKSSSKVADNVLKDNMVPGAMSLLKMENKFSSGQYRDIGDFVSDFRAMLEGCYRLHGVDHWLSKQAQKLELMLEQKLALLSRNLREKTSIVVTSNGCYGLEVDKGATCTSTRRRSTTRSLANANGGSVESIMVQVLRQEELLRAKEEKRLREQEKKEAEGASQKEVEDWDKNLLALAEPTSMETMWEIPAIGHFLCLAQQILNLPEIVFYELERCLLMPQCNTFLSKIMTSLLSPPHRRPTLHRRPNLPYRAWEAALRQKVQQWYTVVGQAENPDRCAEKLGLCSQFFRVLGEVNPLEHAAFHEHPFYKRVWLLKGLCDFVYETQSEVQDAVLGQPIHECREVILGYDAQENSYIHFPQFCGADVRVYKQRPLKAPDFPIPSIQIKRAPRIKLEKTKCKYSNKINGEISAEEKVASPSPGTGLEKYFKYEDSSTEHHFSSNSEEQDTKSDCEIFRPCDTMKTNSCKENVEKPVSPGEIIGYGEPLSPGEIRILENVNKYGEANIVKLDPKLLKENTLKTCQIHLNGNHADSTDSIFHRFARDLILDHGLLNHKESKASKIRAKKKKKKKKKLKDMLIDNMQDKCESVRTHSFRSYKTEIQNKLFLTKKKAKHKKHKSGKKSVSKKVITKKRKTSSSPAAPEFQLVCSNLDELRELKKKIEEELKLLDSNKKKSEKWHFRRQGVKELHCTLIRLLNELLPWEPKLLKAFQRNRARIKKDYDDFKRHSDQDLNRESFSHEVCNVSKCPNAVTSAMDINHQEMLKKDSVDQLKVPEIDLPGKNKLLKKEPLSRDFSKSPPKTSKRQWKQYIHLGNETKETSPKKKLKLDAHEATLHCTEESMHAYIKDPQQTDSESPEVVKGTKPIQALIAKNSGNKVTLTSHIVPSISKSIHAPEHSASSSTEKSIVKPVTSFQDDSKTHLQVVYKMAGGQCVPVDLQNSPLKIQMQPVVDAKTGEKVIQPVLVLPKNLLIQHKEGQVFSKENHFLQKSEVGEHSTPNGSLFSSPSSYVTENTTSKHQSVVHFTKFPSAVVAPHLSKPTSENSVLKSPSEINKGSTALATIFPPSVLPSVMSLAVHPNPKEKTPARGSTGVTNNTTVTSPIQPMDSETKQELKTVCIRDSQSILVRTRGGNTGVVKVQTSHDQSSSVMTPNSIFTFSPQLQSFMVSNTKTSASSSPFLPGFLSSTSGISSSSSSVAVSEVLNKLPEPNLAAQCQYQSTANLCQIAGKLKQPTSIPSTNLSTSSFLPSPLPSVAVGFTDTLGKVNTPVTKTKADKKQTESNGSKIPAMLPDSTSSIGDLPCAPSLHKVMLVTAPSILPPTQMSTLSTSTPSVVSPQKLVFINAQVPSASSSTSNAQHSSKQAVPSLVGRTPVKAAEQPQIFLIPSTFGSPVKISSAPIVSQVKDVKIGLSIGQTILNTSGSTKNILPFNILQNACTKEDSVSKGFGMSATATEIPGVQNGGLGVSNKSGYGCTLSKAKETIGCAEVAPVNYIKAQSNEASVIVPDMSNRLCSSNIGSTVAISTVKTGHLSSSLLLSTTQMPGPTRNVFSSLQMPVISTRPTSCMTSHLAATSDRVSHQPVSKETADKVQFSSAIFPKTLPANVSKPHTVLTPSLATNPSNLEPASVSSQASSHALQATPLPAATQVKGTLNDSCIQQKIVINTSTPLAPGTQITINGTRFIVPPQGLAAGSHVLVISTNLNPGTSLFRNGMQMCPSFTPENTVAQATPVKQNMPLTQPLNHTFNIAKSMNSFGTTKTLPVPHTTTNINSMNLSLCAATSVDGCSLSGAQSTATCKSHLVPVLQSSSQLQAGNTLQYPRDNIAVNSATNRALLSPVVSTETKNADPAFPAHQSYVPEKSHTVAS
ncbi:uncharacterized protein KIAA2026 homolog [Bombina bombina]|uniref:uncharacterized protein KIAA2026 homolog n=1 Tax=Bombina bombina TaxID=8345 RepID=UPI00235AB3B7|nr:uncharacterized protein KIAA2026 homolog [Bombina bombina]